MTPLSIFADGFDFAESPRWRNGELWLSDIGAGHVVAVREDGSRRRIIDVPGRPAGLAWLPDGVPVVASMFERKLYRIADGRLALHADLSGLCTTMINELVSDGSGRLYVGDDGFNAMVGEEYAPGAMILVDGLGTASRVASDLGFPNGAVITADGRLMVAETMGRRISSFAIAPDGGLSDRRIEAEVDGAPDGACLDADGGLWVALIDRERFIRIKDGVVADTIATPGRAAVACALGGPDGRTLFCVTFSGDMAQIGRGAGTSQVETTMVSIPTGNSP